MSADVHDEHHVLTLIDWRRVERSASNPFAYTGPLPPNDLADRDEETARLVELARGGHTVRLEAPRRYGKTSLLLRVLDEAKAEGMITALVDFEDVLSLGGVVNRIERAYSRSLTGGLRRTVERLLKTWDLGLSLGAAGFALELKANPGMDVETVLIRLLEVPEHIHSKSGRRSLIVFDEVQDLLTIPGAAGIVRSVIQHHHDVASYCFAGSSPGLMTRIFDEPDAPFLQQGVAVALGPLRANDLSDHIETRFLATGKDPGEALSPLIRFARGHPQRGMMLAHHLWDLAAIGSASPADLWLDARDAALTGIETSLRAHWAALPVSERRAAAAIALSPSEPGGKGVLSVVGLSQRSVYGALDGLQARGEILSDDGGRRLTDPLLEYWLRERKEL